jgi:hypothetical protein
MPGKREEVMDGLLVTCIGLEARYYTLMERLRVSLPELWSGSLESLMKREGKKEKDNLEYWFDQIRDCIEGDKDIDESFKTPIASKFELILAALDDYEAKFLVYSSKGLRQRYDQLLRTTRSKAREILHLKPKSARDETDLNSQTPEVPLVNDHPPQQ